MVFRLTITILLCILIAAAGCRESRQAQTGGSGGVTITLTVEDDPILVGETTLIVTLTDGSGGPVDGAMVSVRGDMTHAGMVPVLGAAESGQGGVYRVPFEWTMGGSWIVTVEAALPDGTTVIEEFDLLVFARRGNGTDADADADADTTAETTAEPSHQHGGG